jgi:hypothetical protein
MYDHATIPGLPQRLWQAAFYIELVKRTDPRLKASDEVTAMAERFSRQCEEVVAWRKKKLGW